MASVIVVKGQLQPPLMAFRIVQKLAKLRHLNLHRHCFTSSQSQTSKSLTLHADSCISFINQCNSLTPLKIVHACMLKSHLNFNRYFSTHLIAQYASLGFISQAYTLFSASNSTDTFLWNVMMKGFVDNARYNDALVLYSKMRELSIAPDNFTFPFVVKTCGCVGDVKHGMVVHRDLLNFGYQSDVYVNNSLVSMYGKIRRFEDAWKVFDRMHEKNVFSWNSMIGACEQNSRHEEGMRLFQSMLREGIKVNRATVLNVMACVEKEDEADEVYRFVANNGLTSECYVQCAAMVMYARCGRIDLARRFFDQIPVKDLVCWSSMIEAYAQADLCTEALELFNQMILHGVFPDYVTLLGVL